jgi:outer membrane protein assembly factor BamD
VTIILMSAFFARVTPFGLLLALAACFAAPLRADIVWDPVKGWTIEGGVFASLSGPDSGGGNALDLMNKARQAEADGRPGEALPLYETVAEKYPKSDLAVLAIERTFKLRQAAGTTKAGLSFYEKIANKNPRSDAAGEALYCAGEVRKDRRQYFVAFDHFQDVVTKHPNTRHFNAIIAEQYAIATALMDGKRPYWFGLIPGFTSRQRGTEYGELILVTAPHSDYAPLVLMYIARCDEKLGKKEEAIDALDRMTSNYPQSILASDATISLAQVHASLVAGPEYDQANTKLAYEFYDEFTELYPKDPKLPTADKGRDDMRQMQAQSKIVIGDFYFKYRANFVAARVFYHQALDRDPRGPVGTTANLRLAEVDAAEAKAIADGPPKRPWYWWFW